MQSWLNHAYLPWTEAYEVSKVLCIFHCLCLFNESWFNGLEHVGCVFNDNDDWKILCITQNATILRAKEKSWKFVSVWNSNQFCQLNVKCLHNQNFCWNFYSTLCLTISHGSKVTCIGLYLCSMSGNVTMAQRVMLVCLFRGELCEIEMTQFSSYLDRTPVLCCFWLNNECCVFKW